MIEIKISTDDKTEVLFIAELLNKIGIHRIGTRDLDCKSKELCEPERETTDAPVNFTPDEINESLEHVAGEQINMPCVSPTMFAQTETKKQAIESEDVKVQIYNADMKELDMKGFYWDKRIHSSSQSKIEDGTWRKKRGISSELITAVEAEQKAGTKLTEGTQYEPIATTLPIAPPVAVPVPPPTFSPFVVLMNSILELTKQNKITREEINSIINKHGVAKIELLMTRLDLIPVITSEINNIVLARG
jgi:hypothetical protein